MRLLWIFWLGGFLLFASPYRIIDLSEVKNHYNAHDALFVDARDAKMYAKGTIQRAMNIPLKRFKRMKKWFPARKDAPILIFCNGVKCGKSVKLAEKFSKAGYTQLMVYREGYPQWEKHKLPIMATPAPCHCDEGEYLPKTTPVTVAGVALYLADDPSRVDPRWLVPLIKAGTLPSSIQLIDVRPTEQYVSGHLKGAISVPFDPIKHTMEMAKIPTDRAILLYCNHGAISADAYDVLPQEIARRVKVLEADLECDAKGCRLHAQ